MNLKKEEKKSNIDAWELYKRKIMIQSFLFGFACGGLLTALALMLGLW